MLIFWIRFIVVLALCFQLACEMNIINHDPQKAAKLSVCFFNEVLVHKNFDTKLFRPGDPRSRTIELKALVTKLSSNDSLPDTYYASRYERVPGSSHILIYLTGINQNSIYSFYKFDVLLTNDNQYMLVNAERNIDGIPYSPSKLQYPLPQIVTRCKR